MYERSCMVNNYCKPAILFPRIICTIFYVEKFETDKYIITFLKYEFCTDNNCLFT